VTLKEFLSETSFQLSPSADLLCDQGISIMNNAIDPMHDGDHINSMFTKLYDYMNEKNLTTRDLNLEVMLLSICWHDTWKAMKQPRGILDFMLHQLVEGVFSARNFQKAAINTSLDNELISEVSYATRKHSYLQFTAIKTPEAQLLWDIDTLEMWNIERYIKAGEEFFMITRRRYQKFMEAYMKRQNKRFYTQWARSQFPIIKDDFFSRFSTEFSFV